MKTLIALACRWLAALMILIYCFAVAVVAQNDGMDTTTGQQPGKPRFIALAPTLHSHMLAPSSPLRTWESFYSDANGGQWDFTMVGADPATNQSVTIPTYLIPIELVVKDDSLNQQLIFDPLCGDILYPPRYLCALIAGVFTTPVARTYGSPIFDSTTNYTLGGVNVGTTQYIDAFQRANFWNCAQGQFGCVQNNPNSHLLLQPRFLPFQSLNVPAQYGFVGNPLGGNLYAEVDVNWFQAQLENLLKKFQQIHPNSLPIFMTYDVFLFDMHGCCIGGYHTATGSDQAPQTYIWFTYGGYPGDFSQDISALSHEVGEWADDPYINNQTPCQPPNDLLEVGDPLEGTLNYGTHQVLLHGFSYNVQDLAFLTFFRASPTPSVNGWYSFYNAGLPLCK